MRLDGYRKAEEDSEKHVERRSGRLNAVKEADSERQALLRRPEQLEKAAGSLPPRPSADYSKPPTNRPYYGPRWAYRVYAGPFVSQKKTVQNSFCQNFVNFLLILMLFGR